MMVGANEIETALRLPHNTTTQNKAFK